MPQTAWGGRRSATSLRSARFAAPLVSCCNHMEAQRLKAYILPTPRLDVTHTQMWPKIEGGPTEGRIECHTVSEIMLTSRCDAARQRAPRHPVQVEWYRTALDKGTPVASAARLGGGSKCGSEGGGGESEGGGGDRGGEGGVQGRGRLLRRLCSRLLHQHVGGGCRGDVGGGN